MTDQEKPNWITEVFQLVIADEFDFKDLQPYFENRIRRPSDAGLFVCTMLHFAAAFYATTVPEWSEDTFYEMEIISVEGDPQSGAIKARLAVSRAFIAHLNGDQRTAIDLVDPHLPSDETTAVVLATTIELVRDAVRSIDQDSIDNLKPNDLDKFTKRRPGAAFGL